MTTNAEEIVRNLLRVVGRELPYSAAEELLDENLTAHMDGKPISRGRGAWFRWVRFLHQRAAAKYSEFGLRVEDIREENGVVSVRAKWRGVRNGKEEFSQTGEVIYETRGGKIVNVWTKRKNYVFIHGLAVKFRPLFWLLLLRLALRKNEKNMD